MVFLKRGAMTKENRDKCDQALNDFDDGRITAEEALKIFIAAGADPEDARVTIAGESDVVYRI